MKNRKFIFIILSIFISVMAFIAVLSNKSEKIIATSSNADNKKIEWGIKRRENNEQPDLGERNRKIIDNYNGIAIGNNEEKYLYLTFDEGYEAGFTENILNVLNQNEVKAAFFITGHYLNSQPELVKRMIDEGHIIGNHTVNHYSMPDLTEDKIKEEVMTLHTKLYEKFGYEMKYIRPPMGEYSERTLEVCKNLGYKTVMWSFAYDDWDTNKQGREEYGRDKILKNVHNGEVILLHATSADNSNILDEVIKQIKATGYEFRTLDEFRN